MASRESRQWLLVEVLHVMSRLYVPRSICLAPGCPTASRRSPQRDRGTRHFSLALYAGPLSSAAAIHEETTSCVEAASSSLIGCSGTISGDQCVW